MWMNRWEIDDAAERYANREVLGIATRFLKQFRDEVDNNSDGWAYWQAPTKAAEKLMALIQSPGSATIEKYRAALVPIRSFMTRKGNAAGMKLPDIK